MPVALRSRENSCSRLIVGIVGSNAAGGHECSSIALALCCAVSGLCDMLISRLEESYRVCVCVCVSECDLETSSVRRHRPELGFLPYRIQILV
jgi:hypothetical protein